MNTQLRRSRTNKLVGGVAGGIAETYGWDPTLVRLGFVILTLAFRQDGRRWTGECLELGTATYGRTLKQAHDELAEMVALHLNTLEDIGERERFFEEHGIRFYTDDVPEQDLAARVPIDETAYFQPHRVALRKQLVGAGT